MCIEFKATAAVRNQSASCLQLWFQVAMLYFHCFSTPLYNMPLGRVRQSRGLKLKGAHQLLVCVDNINLVGATLHAIKKHRS